VLIHHRSPLCLELLQLLLVHRLLGFKLALELLLHGPRCVGGVQGGLGLGDGSLGVGLEVS
jgi:hypothetical protein